MTSDRDPRRALRRDARENLERILQAATSVLAERGPDAPMEAIAKRAGLGIGTLYRRFPSREALLAAVVEREVQRLEGLARAALGTSPWDGLVAFLEHAVASPVTDPALRRILVDAVPRATAHDRWRGTLMPAYRALIDAARERGATRNDLAPTDLPLLVMAVAAVARQTGGTDSPAARRVLAIVMAGLRPSSTGALPVRAVPETTLAEILLSSRAEPSSGGD